MNETIERLKKEHKEGNKYEVRMFKDRVWRVYDDPKKAYEIYYENGCEELWVLLYDGTKERIY